MIEKLWNFISNICNLDNEIEIENLELAVFKILVNDVKKANLVIEPSVREFREKHNIFIKPEEIDFFKITSPVIRWNRPEQNTKEGFLSGGFSFNGLTNVFLENELFWEYSIKEFAKLEEVNNIDIIKELKWIECITPEVDAEYTPQYGCVKLKEKKFPNQFFFYDSGLVYDLPFKSYDEYLEGLMSLAAVMCWQYFFIEPAIIIQKNKGVKYITWSLHSTTDLDRKLNDLQYHPDTQYDRLDLIAEYLERCIRLLPDSFPFINFEKQIEWYKEFEKQYNQSKNKS